MTKKKRFIAGTTCPMCQQVDSLRVWEENQIEVVECVECDYIEHKSPQAVEDSTHSKEQLIGIFKPE